MRHAAALAALDASLPTDGTVSVWFGRPAGPPAYVRLADVEHYAASTIKLPILVAAYRAGDAGDLDLDQQVGLHDEFPSAAGGRYLVDRGYDNDEEPWERLGEVVTLRWLARRMIVRSSNLATGMLLERLGHPAVNAALAHCGAHRSAVRRGICDGPAVATGATNVTTAADLASVLSALHAGRAASAEACAEMLAVLEAQEYRDQIPAGLPTGTQVASKGGWAGEVRHDAALVRPVDASAYVLVVCTTGVDPALRDRLIPDLAAASWADRRSLGSPE